MRCFTNHDAGVIHEETLNLLKEVGIFFWQSPTALKILKDAGCRIDEGRVFFPRNVVEKAVSTIPDRKALFMYSQDGGRRVSLDRGQTHFSTVGNAYYIHDYETGKARDAEEQDVEKYWVLFEGLENFDIRVGELILGSWRERGQKETSLRCATTDESIAYLRDFFCRKKVTTKPVITNIGRSKEQVRLGILQSMTHRSSLKELSARPTNVVWVNTLSPMQYDDQTDGLIEGARQGIPIMISPEIIGGSSGPVTLGGLALQNNAEVLAGVVLAQIAKPGATVIYGSLSGPMDPRVGDISLGGIEAFMVQSAAVQMADFYGLPSRIAVGNTGAKEPGVRAMSEAILGCYMGAAAGANIITTGLLNCTLTLSYEHMAVLDEIFGAIKKALSGFEIDKEHLGFEAIRQEGRPAGTFLGLDHTLRFMRNELFVSEYVGRTPGSFDDWYERANRRTREMFSRKPAVAFDEKTETNLSLIEDRIREDNDGWREDGADWWKFYVQDFARDA
jgi:trimethylamine---corrinoid protein Co-methyltransferase